MGHCLKIISINRHAFQIVVYYDDLEVVNPLGSYTKKHKLGCLYFFLGNIRPHFRSTLNCIHLVAVGRTKDMYLLRHCCEYTTGIIELGCGRETNKARGVAECLIRSRDHIRVQ